MIVPQAHVIWRRVGSRKHLHWTLSITAFVALLLAFPSSILGQVGGSPFESGFTALQTLFTRTIAKVASLIAIVVGGYMFAAWRTRRQKESGRRSRRHRDRRTGHEYSQLAVGHVIAQPMPTIDRQYPNFQV